MEKLNRTIDEIEKVIKGKRDVITQVFMAILAGGHVLMEDIPGVGKTTLALAFSRALSLEYHRVQFTPDVLPGDITGFSMYNKKTEEFEYVPGSAFCSLLLADEINRTSPKTQSALLEIMEERKVTVDGVTRELPDPFIVIATQNPFGSAGTQRLPESQMDRFMIRLSMGYPQRDSELEILKGEGIKRITDVSPVMTREELIEYRDKADHVFVSDKLYEYVIDITGKTREHELTALGMSPRGSLAVTAMAKANAMFSGRDFVTPEDVKYVLGLAGGHRIVLSPKGKAKGMDEGQVLDLILQEVSVPEVS